MHSKIDRSNLGLGDALDGVENSQILEPRISPPEHGDLGKRAAAQVLAGLPPGWR